MENNQNNHIEQLVLEMQYRNYSTRTVTNYLESLKNLEKKTGLPLNEITGEHVKKYLNSRIMQEGISVSTINQCISAYKILQTDVLKRDWEAIRIKRPRKTVTLPVILSKSEIESLINATKNVKHKAILMLAYSSGLRLQEVQTIKPSAIDSQRMTVHVVQGKGKKDRYTLLSAKTLEILRIYYKMYRPAVYLFEPHHKKGHCLSDRTYGHIVKKNGIKAGIKKTISFHTLRHCFATHLMESGVNLKLVQQFLGHTSLKTTSIYLHLTETTPGNVVSPLDSMNI
jgi:site-specific recombinase XerD